MQKKYQRENDFRLSIESYGNTSEVMLWKHESQANLNFGYRITLLHVALCHESGIITKALSYR